jgi:hypothetical protein
MQASDIKNLQDENLRRQQLFALLNLEGEVMKKIQGKSGSADSASPALTTSGLDEPVYFVRLVDRRCTIARHSSPVIGVLRERCGLSQNMLCLAGVGLLTLYCF